MLIHVCFEAGVCGLHVVGFVELALTLHRSTIIQHQSMMFSLCTRHVLISICLARIVVALPPQCLLPCLALLALWLERTRWLTVSSALLGPKSRYRHGTAIEHHNFLEMAILQRTRLLKSSNFFFFSPSSPLGNEMTLLRLLTTHVRS